MPYVSFLRYGLESLYVVEATVRLEIICSQIGAHTSENKSRAVDCVYSFTSTFTTLEDDIPLLLQEWKRLVARMGTGMGCSVTNPIHHEYTRQCFVANVA